MSESQHTEQESLLPVWLKGLQTDNGRKEAAPARGADRGDRGSKQVSPARRYMKISPPTGHWIRISPGKKGSGLARASRRTCAAGANGPDALGLIAQLLTE